MPARGLDPAAVAGKPIEQQVTVPPAVQQILTKACRDCHSNETRVPWYGKVAPVSWLLEHDVEKARKAMNFSSFLPPGASPHKAAGLLMAACAGVQSGHMPPAGYKYMHSEATISPQEAATFCAWSTISAKQLLHK